MDGSFAAADFGPLSSQRKLRLQIRNRNLPSANQGDSVEPARLLLDALEPRILLNADTLVVQLAATPADTQDHDVLVRMVDQTVQVGAHSQVIQRIQVIDAAHGGAVLAFGDLSSISAISIQGGAGNDTVTVDADSFGQNTIPTLNIDGGGGINSLVIDHSSQPLNWQIDGQGDGSVNTPGASGSPAPWLNFSNVQSLTGGAGFDTLSGPATNTTWQVTGTNSGTVQTGSYSPTAFSGFKTSRVPPTMTTRSSSPVRDRSAAGSTAARAGSTRWWSMATISRSQ